ncbi:restriction endonuclease subunit S [Prevotella sp. E15-22]|uniref:restriction endonuclease subunit S n=1 Tax=Prevotella sp. E15-22 TaxID=2937774 RepID=UPI002070000E|nr:restriction endonuclease subunit S [Prevotella sp. E15-22]UPS45474.1 restriction endonuclease subunit S [Prevotella sp. E15-22]
MNAQQLKNAILQEAIEGRLVPQDPNDEPASALLERIRKEKEELVKEGKLKKSALKEIPFSEDEAPFEIPDSWEWCKLGWIGDWGAGATPAKGNPDFYNNGTIPWLRTGELNNGFVYDSEIKVTPKALEKCSLRMCEVGDVLIAMYGATIGKVAIAGIKLTTNQACCACTPYHVYNKYLLYYLMASKKTFTEMGEGGAQPNISREKIVAFPFALPPLAEQHRIVAKIEELLPKVEEYGKAQDALNKLNAELPERLKKSILQEAIEGRLVPQDPNDEPASVLLAKIRKEKEELVKAGKLKKKDLEVKPISEDEIPFEIPESWEWIRLGDVTEIARGGSPRPIKEFLTDAPNGLNWIKIGDTDKGGKYINSCKEKIKPEGLKKTRMVHPGDFLLTNSMSFGRPYITNIEGCIHDGWLMISPYAEVFDQSFLFYVLSSAFAHKQFSDKVAGAVVQNLNSDKVADSFVPIPPLAEQHRIVEKLEQVLGEIDKLKK